MTENKDSKSLLKKIDLGDMKILIIGVILLIIPVLFLLFSLSRTGKKDVATSARDRLGMSKAAFSFQRTASQHPAGKTGTSAKPSAKQLSPEKEWAQAAERISKAPAYIPPQIAALPPSERKYFEAEKHTGIRNANVLISQGRLDEARAICDEILRTENENEFLRFMASGNLCTIYDEKGDIAALRKEFLRYLDLLESLKIKGFEAKNIKAGYLSMNKMLLDFGKVRSDPIVRSHIGEVIRQNGAEGVATVDSVLDDTLGYLKNFPSSKH
ncbi:MAG: hypothetical protein CVV41_18310 [Candidatus Riflebacteria bacterium HGW-Riflebacteria-1]|jgi:tetratricopeptide (TPR) repeat protein|nr:MAG: hypothetical protein CVV41_18310 [Candidatus Riflebacteria bacterium HGW-Riflebacteria-1]